MKDAWICRCCLRSSSISKRWRKDVAREVAMGFHNHAYLRFKYVFVKLCDFQGRIQNEELIVCLLVF